MRRHAEDPVHHQKPSWDEARAEVGEIAHGIVGAWMFRNSRWLLSFDHEGNHALSMIPFDACVMSPERLLRALSEEGNGIPLSTADLARFIEAATKKLAHRCAYYESKTERRAA